MHRYFSVLHERSRFATQVAAIAILGLAGAASTAQAEPKGTYRFAAAYEPASWNPQRLPNRLYSGLVYEGLVRMAPDGNTLKPELAESWALTDKDLTFKLRQDVKFHDGTPFNADAVIANFDAIVASTSQWRDSLSSVEKVEKVDDFTVKLELKRPTPTLLNTLSQVGFLMISPKALADGSWETTPVGSGPYKLNEEASVRGSKYVFDVFSDYYAPDAIGPKTVELYYIPEGATRYNAIVAGQVDAAIVGIPEIEQAKKDGLEAHMWPVLRYHLNINDRTTLFPDPKVRQAMCTAFPVEQMNQARYDGLVGMSNQMFDEGDPAHVADLGRYNYDIEAAKKLMDEAGNPKISIEWPSLPQARVFGELVKESWEKIGIKVDVKVLQASEYFRTSLSATYPVIFDNMDGENAGMYAYYSLRFGKDGPANVFHSEPPAELKAAFERSLTASQDEVPGIYQEMTKMIHDQALDCGYLDINQVVAYNPKTVSEMSVTVWEPSATRYSGIRMAE